MEFNFWNTNSMNQFDICGPWMFSLTNTQLVLWKCPWDSSVGVGWFSEFVFCVKLYCNILYISWLEYSMAVVLERMWRCFCVHLLSIPVFQLLVIPFAKHIFANVFYPELQHYIQKLIIVRQFNCISDFVIPDLLLWHLKTFSLWYHQGHEMTSIGLLLGVSSAKLGTMDMSITRLLSIHIPALLPPTSTELDVPHNVQVF